MASVRQSLENDEKNEHFIKRRPGEFGYFLMNRNLIKAKWYFDQAVEELPEELYCLLGRAETKIRLLDSHGAKQDIKRVFKLKPDDLKAHALKNEILYMRKRFEEALILNDRCLALRKYPDNFFMGHMKCMDAILNGVTWERAGHPLRDHYKIIRRQAWEDAWMRLQTKTKIRRTKQQQNAMNPTLNLLIQPPPKFQKPCFIRRSSCDVIPENVFSTQLIRSGSNVSQIEDTISSSEERPQPENLEMPYETMSKLISFPYKPLQPRTTNLLNFLSEKYLEKLHKDKRFIEDVFDSKGFKLPNTKGVNELTVLIEQGYNYLIKLQHFMRCKRPFYHIKYQERKLTKTVKSRMDLLLRQQREEVKQSVHKILLRLRHAYILKDLISMEKIMEHFVELYIVQPKIVICEIYQSIMEALNMMRDAYFSFGLFTPKMTNQQKIDRVKFKLGIYMQRIPSRDSFINNLRQHKPTNWKSKIKEVEKRLKIVNYPEEFIFFNYELARMNLEIGRYDLVGSFATKSITQAREIRKMRWVINAKLLLVKACIKQNNKVYALKVLEKTMLLSKTLSCPELLEFLAYALEVLANTDFRLFSHPKTIIEKRQRQILNLLKENEKIKREAEVFFRKQSLCSTNRRMSLVPGVRPMDDTRRKVRTISTLPKDTVSSLSGTSTPKKGNLHEGTFDYISLENEQA